MNFAGEIAAVLNDAGIKPHWPITTNGLTMGFGIHPHSSPDRAILKDAFNAAGLPLADLESDNPQNGEPPWLTIMVGSKPPLFEDLANLFRNI